MFTSTPNPFGSAPTTPLPSMNPDRAMSPALLLALKIALSLLVGAALLYPFFAAEPVGGVFAELQLFGTAGAVAAATVFLLLVALYARDLSRTLQLVAPASRTASPASVWWMFLLPYNFIEDFFIVANVARSLEREAAQNAALARFRSFGMRSGIGWCAAQLVSLVPNEIGSAAGAVAVVAWGWHWAFIRRALHALSAASPTRRHAVSSPSST
jgi:hypothetical protein